ncbi:MAG TPA: MFS transporter [Methylomirabilota bacterium]|jgi:DHA2 family methylenomycin A resistance protein-like MFS transporter
MIRWIAAGGAFVVSLDSIMNVAFPAIAAAFAVPPERMRWVIIGYVGTYALTAFVGGALADRVGHGRVFRAGLALSAVAFVVAGLAPTFGWLLVGRVLQGLGGGCVYGTAPGIVTLAAAPADRGRALGFLGAAIGLGLSVGPLAAGVLVDTLGWRAIFHVRVPPALLALGAALAALPAASAPRAPRLVAAADIVRAPVLAAGALAFVANAGIFAIWLLAPFYLVAARGLEASAAGVLFMLTPLGTALAASPAGRLADRIGARTPIVAGLALEALGLGLLSRADATAPIALLAVSLFAAGFGLGLFQVPNMTVVMAAFGAAQQGAAGGFAFLARTLGTVAGVAALAQLFAVRRLAVGLAAAAGEAFLAAALAVGLAAALAALRRG